MPVQDLQAILDEIPTHRVVSQAEWIEARRELLQREKQHRREADRLAADRRALPWVKIEKPYRFDGARGVQALADLFDGRSQLIVYHFMFDDDWEEGCKSCSFLSDHIDGANLHLAHHDVTLLAVSRAPWPKLKAFRQRMGWRFDWLSSGDSDFNSDFNASPSAAEIAADQRYYNYALHPGAGGEWPGVSVFFRNAAGEIFHTYSSYARGGDILIGAHNYLDLTPKGRAEAQHHGLGPAPRPVRGRRGPIHRVLCKRYLNIIFHGENRHATQPLSGIQRPMRRGLQVLCKKSGRRNPGAAALQRDTGRGPDAKGDGE